MRTVEEIKGAIEALAEEQFAQLREWFSKRDWEKWDSQIEEDSNSGALDFLGHEAQEAKAKGHLRDL